MSTFAPETVRVAAPDPFKHVNFTQGMVLGVDDFTQEFAYLAGRDQLIARDLLGYGTVCGLQVAARRAGSEGWEIVVEAGTAVNPRGEWIRVPTAQCARLRSWIDAHPDEIRRYAGSPPAGLRVYVVLCYRDCKVDLVPIPGEPCRSEDDSFEPSRVQDDYALELWFEPPRQTQEDAIRDFGQWLSQIEIDDIPDSAANRAAFARAVRHAVPQYQSPPTAASMSPPDYMLGSPPADLRIPRAALYRYLRAAFHAWVTELRPLWLGKNQTCAGQPPDERCVLLAEVAIPLTDEGLLSDVEDVAVDVARRPYLLSLRMLQEWLMRFPHAAGGAPLTLAGDASGDPGDNRVTRLHGLPIAAPSAPADAGRLLGFDGAGWRLVAPPGAPPPVTLGGDVTGAPGTNTVARLQNVPLVAPDPATQAGYLLGYTGTEWRLTPPPAPAGGSPIVAAGRFDAKANTLFEFNKLVARRIDFAGATYYFLTFSGITAGGQYVVKGTVVNSLRGEPRFIEAIDLRDDPAAAELRLLVEEYNGTGPEFPIDIEVDLLVRVSREVDDQVRGFMVEVSQF